MEGKKDLPQCDLGTKLGDECHNTRMARKTGFFRVDTLSNEDQELLAWRSGVMLEEIEQICFHHEKMFLSRFMSEQRTCADPGNIHTKQISRKCNFHVLV